MESEWGYVIVTDSVIQVAVYTGLVVVVLIVILMLQVLFLRLHMIISRKRRLRWLKKWRPQLTHSLLGGKVELSVLPRAQIFVFLEEWNRLFGVVRGEQISELERIAHSLRIGYFARGLLKRRSMRMRLFALITLGHMREYAAWDEIRALLHHPHPTLSLTAARALIWIDPKHAIDIIIPIISQREDWPWANVAHVLKQAPVSQVCRRLSEEAKCASAKRQSGLLRYLEAARCVQLTDAVLKILKTTSDDHVASVCLHIINDPAALAKVREHTRHQRWHVRMHAAAALGRIGMQSDVAALEEMLSDEQWWVRYRAAQALCSSPFVKKAQLQSLCEQHPDAFARDILAHVLAEMKVL